MKKQFANGEVIFYEGEEGSCFYEVINGSVGIYTNYEKDNQQKLTDVKSGHIFGEMALVDAFPRSATAVANEDTELNMVSLDEVKDYFTSAPEKVVFILTELTSNLARLTEEYSEVCATIRQLYPEDTERPASIVEKIKKFALEYDFITKAKQPSAEFLRESGMTGHKDGFSKNVEKYKKGTIIFREGEPGSCMYDIHYGSVGIYTDYATPKEKCLTTLYADKFFGEIGMLGGKIRTATAVALEEGTIVEHLYTDDFEELFQKNPKKIEMIIKHISYRIRRLTCEYVNACKIVYDAAQSELKNSVSQELKDKARNFETHLYD